MLWHLTLILYLHGLPEDVTTLEYFKNKSQCIDRAEQWKVLGYSDGYCTLEKSENLNIPKDVKVLSEKALIAIILMPKEKIGEENDTY